MVKTLKTFFSRTNRPMNLKSGMPHWLLEYYHISSNDDPVLILTYFTAIPNLVHYAFVREKGKTIDFSETIIVYDIKVGNCSELNEYIKLYDYQRPRSLRFNIFNTSFP